MARRFRGVARAQLLNSDTPIEERQQTIEDLQAWYAEHPEDDEVAHQIAMWNLAEADRLDRPGGRPDEAQTLREQAVALSTQTVEADPDDPQRLLDHLRVLLNPRILPNDPAQGQAASERQRELAKPYLDRLEQMMLADPSPQHIVLGAVDMLARGDVEAQSAEAGGNPRSSRGVQRAQALLEVAVAAEPDKFTYRMVLGELLRRQGQTDQALQVYQTVRNMDVTGDPIRVLRGTTMINTAAALTADLLMSRSANADTQQQKQLQAEVQQIINELVAQEGETPRVKKLRGKLALNQGNAVAAAKDFDDAASQFSSAGDTEQYLESLLLAANAHQRTGNWGAAVERLERVLQARPNLPQVQLQLAGLLMQHRQYNQAAPLVDQVLATDPGNERAQRIKGALLARDASNAPQAIETFERLYSEGDPNALQPLAQLYLAQDRRPEAIDLLERHLDQQPDDVRALTVLLPMSEQVEAKQARIDAAEAAAVDPRAIAMMRRSLDADQPRMEIDELVDQLLEDQDDPFLRALGEARLYAQANDADKTREALARAAQLNPDHAEVIEMQFSLALQDGDTETAEALAERARANNTDLAQGEFYRGRLAGSQQQWDRAIAAFRRGLTLREVYSEGWRQLGAALLASGQLDAAAEAFETSIAQQPDNVRALQSMAQVLLSRQQPAEALTYLRRAHEYRPNDSALLEQYLTLEQQAGDKDRVIALRKRIAQANPQNIANRRALAYVLASTGQDAEARAMIDEVIAEEGRTRTNVQILAAIAAELGDRSDGLDEIQSYLAERGDQADVDDQLMLARYLRVTGDLEGSFAAYRRAMQLDQSDDDQVKRELADIQFAAGLHEQSADLYSQLHAAFPDDDKVALRYAETCCVSTGPMRRRRSSRVMVTTSSRWSCGP